MNITASHIIDKMIKKLRSTQGELETGALNKEATKSSLISVKVYCDLLLEELEEKSSVVGKSENNPSIEKSLHDKDLKPSKGKAVLYEEDDDANGASLFDF